MRFATGLSIALAVFFGTIVRADIILLHNVTYTQNFDTLASTPNGGTGTVLPDSPNGWTFVESGNQANTSYGIGTGSSGSGNTYSFGSTGSTDRAFGSLNDSSPLRQQTIGARFQSSILNLKPFTKVKISYTGEQWRLGAAGHVDRLDFQISSDATSLTTGTWTDVNSLDFIAPVTGGGNGALDGNLAANRTVFPTTKIALPTSVSPGATFWFRVEGFDASGNDDGLAIDDFSLTGIPEPANAFAIGAFFVALACYARRRHWHSQCP